VRTLIEIQRDIEALTSVMASGALSVSYSDRRIQYHSYSEMEKALARLNRELKGSVEPSHQRIRRYTGFNQAR
jgi:hypothetical protein